MALRKFKITGTISMNYESVILAEDEDEAWELAEEQAMEGLADKLTEPVGDGDVCNVTEIH